MPEQNNNCLVFIESARISVSETNGSVRLPIARTGLLDNPVTIQYAITSNDAEAGADYVDTTGFVTMKPGENLVHVPVEILNDAASERPRASFSH